VATWGPGNDAGAFLVVSLYSAYFDSLDPSVLRGPGLVGGSGPAPVWLDLAP
jgi:hypothetical protein